MNHPNPRNHAHPLLQLLKDFMNKLRQNPNVYPIRYYKKHRPHS